MSKDNTDVILILIFLFCILFFKIVSVQNDVNRLQNKINNVKMIETHERR